MVLHKKKHQQRNERLSISAFLHYHILLKTSPALGICLLVCLFVALVALSCIATVEVIQSDCCDNVALERVRKLFSKSFCSDVDAIYYPAFSFGSTNQISVNSHTNILGPVNSSMIVLKGPMSAAKIWGPHL